MTLFNGYQIICQESWIHSNNMGDTPLSGEYAITDNLKTDLDVWAKNNDININYLAVQALLKGYI